jgi:hypothetical protein
LTSCNDDVEDGTLSIAVPDKRDLDLGQTLALDFAREWMPDDFDPVRYFFSGRGAYRNFRFLLRQRGVLDTWHAFETKPRNRPCANGADCMRSSSMAEARCSAGPIAGQSLLPRGSIDRSASDLGLAAAGKSGRMRRNRVFRHPGLNRPARLMREQRAIKDWTLSKGIDLIYDVP